MAKLQKKLETIIFLSKFYANVDCILHKETWHSIQMSGLGDERITRMLLVHDPYNL
jgi:hypothetical protein